MLIYKLPDLTQFKALKKEKSPWDKFYDWIVPLLPHNTALGKILYNPTVWNIPEGHYISVSSFIVCKEDYEAISKLTHKWAKKKLRGHTENRINSSVAFLELDIAPKEVPMDDTFKQGYVYIMEDYLKVKGKFF